MFEARTSKQFPETAFTEHFLFFFVMLVYYCSYSILVFTANAFWSVLTKGAEVEEKYSQIFGMLCMTLFYDITWENDPLRFFVNWIVLCHESWIYIAMKIFTPTRDQNISQSIHLLCSLSQYGYSSWEYDGTLLERTSVHPNRIKHLGLSLTLSCCCLLKVSLTLSETSIVWAQVNWGPIIRLVPGFCET